MATRIWSGDGDDNYLSNPNNWEDGKPPACAPVKFQAKFKLEAVGEDVDGIIKPVGELTYAPQNKELE